PGALPIWPRRGPRSRSACRTQRRNASGVQPTLPAIEAIAAHCDPCSPWCSSTIRTARSRSSGEYRVDVFFMAPSSQRLEPPEKPGRFKSVALTMRVTPIRELGNQTLEQAVLAGEAEKALRYLQSISGGQNG